MPTLRYCFCLWSFRCSFLDEQRPTFYGFFNDIFSALFCNVACGYCFHFIQSCEKWKCLALGIFLPFRNLNIQHPCFFIFSSKSCDCKLTKARTKSCCRPMCLVYFSCFGLKLGNKKLLDWLGKSLSTGCYERRFSVFVWLYLFDYHAS